MKTRLRLGYVSILLCAVTACATQNSAVIIRDAGQLQGREGARVIIEGRVAREIWQHMMSPISDYPHENYFDIGTGQIVVYTKKPLECEGLVRASGTIVKLEGSSKNPYRKETCTEYHVNVDAWECLK